MSRRFGASSTRTPPIGSCSPRRRSPLYEDVQEFYVAEIDGQSSAVVRCTCCGKTWPRCGRLAVDKEFRGRRDRRPAASDGYCSRRGTSA